MLGAGQGVGDQGGEQAVDGAEQGQNDRRFHGLQQEAGGRQAQLHCRQSGGHLPDDRRVVQPQHAQQRAGSQRHERCGKKFRHALRPEDSNGESDGGDGESADADIAYRFRQRGNRSQGSARRGGRSQERQGLDQHDDDADTGHEPGNHHIGRVGYEPADPGQAQKHLQKTGQDDHHQGFGEIAGVAGDDDRHGDGHGSGGSGYLRPRAAEHRREEADRDRAVKARGRPHARRDAEGERHRQRHHH